MDPVTIGLAIAALGSGAIGYARGRTRQAVATLTRPRPAPSSAPTGQDARDLATFDGMVDHPGYAVTPAGILATFREAERGYPARQCDLIDDLVENDGHLRNLFEQREQAVAGKPWTVQAGGVDVDDDLAARVFFEALKRLPMIVVYQHLLGANRYGWAAAEIDWSVVTVEGRPFVVPSAITPVPARRFRISTATGSLDALRLYTAFERPSGDELRPAKWIVVRRAGTWLARAGLMRTAAWPAMGKRFGFRDWMIYSQRFGLPLPLATYGENADDDDIDVARQIVASIGSDGGAAIPDSIKVEFADATKGGDNSRIHGGLVAHCNAEMSKLINGSTLSNDNAGSGGASYALGEVHASIRWDNVIFDAEMLQEAIRTQLADPFVRFNALRASAPLVKIQVVRDLDPKARVAIADTLRNKLGIEVSTSQLRQELGFREPSGSSDSAPGAPAPAAAPGPAPDEESTP